jgi:HBS1-like protein
VIISLHLLFLSFTETRTVHNLRKMSRHQAFRNVQSTVSEHLYDDDDYYSDEAEEELSAEDKALMEQGTADVRAALGVEASKVTTAQIQEALWHYFYDVDKSVTYLLTKFIAPPPPKAAKSAQKGTSSGKHTFFITLTQGRKRRYRYLGSVQDSPRSTPRLSLGSLG